VTPFAFDQAQEIERLTTERNRLLAEMVEIREACGEYLTPHETVAGAIGNIRQIASMAMELKASYAQQLAEQHVLLARVASQTRHATACDRLDADDCACGALPAERAALERLREYCSAHRASRRAA
jgi:hypothetical protein